MTKSTGYVTDAESEIRVRFDKKMISYLASEVGPAIRKNEEKIWRKKRLPLISGMCKQFGSEAVKSSGFYRKRLIKAFICEDVKKISKLTGNKNLRNWAVMIIKGPNRLKIAKEFTYKHRYLKQPMLDNTVLFRELFRKKLF